MTNPDVARWKELAHRALDDTFEPLTNIRMYGPKLSDSELKEFNEIDAKLGFPSKKVINLLQSIAKDIKP